MATVSRFFSCISVTGPDGTTPTPHDPALFQIRIEGSPPADLTRSSGIVQSARLPASDPAGRSLSSGSCRPDSGKRDRSALRDETGATAQAPAAQTPTADPVPARSAVPAQAFATAPAAEALPTQTGALMRQAQTECRERIATCRKLLDELNGILATSRSHASYRTGCAARDAMSRTLARLEELDADYTSWLGSLAPDNPDR